MRLQEMRDSVFSDIQVIPAGTVSGSAGWCIIAVRENVEHPVMLRGMLRIFRTLDAACNALASVGVARFTVFPEV